MASHCNTHRKAFILLGEAANHVLVQIPDKRTRVTNLMDSFETVDPTVLAAVLLVHQDEANKRLNFEAAVTFLIQSCPVVSKQKKMVTIDPNLLAINVLPTASGKAKTGSTGVPLRYHKMNEFKKLTAEQKTEISAWNKANKGTKRKGMGEGKKSPKKWKSQLSAVTGIAEGWF
jgi:hypothetical protein